jgi:hypothetical protein
MKFSGVYKIAKNTLGKYISFSCILHCGTYLEIYSDMANMQICNDFHDLLVDYYIFKE